MKSFMCTIVAASTFAVSVASFAQQEAPVTRSQVRNELVQLEKHGYSPSSNDNYYPNDIQAAEGRVAASKGSVSGAGDYGSDTGGTSSAAAPKKPSFLHRSGNLHALPGRQNTDECVGPPSFCNIYFGGS